MVDVIPDRRPGRSLFILTLLLLALSASSAEEDWNDAGIEWVKEGGWQGALDRAGETGRPILLLVHRTWCGACKQLRPRFAESKEIERLAGDFVMVRTHEEGGDFDGDLFKPDGGYFPRILFFDSAGNFLEQVTQREDKYKYFHYEEASIVKAMGQASKLNAAGKPKETAEEDKEDENDKEEL